MLRVHTMHTERENINGALESVRGGYFHDVLVFPEGIRGPGGPRCKLIGGYRRGAWVNILRLSLFGE